MGGNSLQVLQPTRHKTDALTETDGLLKELPLSKGQTP